MSKRPLSLTCAVVMAASLLQADVSAFQPSPIQHRVASTAKHSAPLAYSSGVTLEPRAPFEDRMRKLLQKTGTTALPKKTKTVNPTKPAHVHEVVSFDDFKRVVVDETEQITVVRYYAPWCRACKAVQKLFYRLDKSHPNVKLVEVPVTKDNQALHKGLGIPSLPYGHIYHPTKGLVEELRISKTRFCDFTSILDSYLSESCPLQDEVDSYTNTFDAPYQRN